MKRMVRCLIVLAALMGGALRAQNITGTWQGTLKAETNQRIVLKIFNEDQRLKGSMYNSARRCTGDARDFNYHPGIFSEVFDPVRERKFRRQAQR